MNYFENIDEPEMEVKKRPVFLTVLCILTYVGCGLGLIGAIYGLAINQEESLMKSFEMQKNNPAAAGMFGEMVKRMPDFVKWTAISNYASLVNTALCLTGALMMWNLRKLGFMLYTAGQLVVVGVGIAFCVVISDVPIMGIISVISTALSVVVYAAFIVMYGVNLKHMR